LEGHSNDDADVLTETFGAKVIKTAGTRIRGCQICPMQVDVTFLPLPSHPMFLTQFIWSLV
jgi:hypothetical protein